MTLTDILVIFKNNVCLIIFILSEVKKSYNEFFEGATLISVCNYIFLQSFPNRFGLSSICVYFRKNLKFGNLKIGNYIKCIIPSSSGIVCPLYQ